MGTASRVNDLQSIHSFWCRQQSVARDEIWEGAVQITSLSKNARDLLRRRASGEHIEVTPGNIKAYRELVRAGVMYPLSAYLRGPESAFRFTNEGWERREELQRVFWRLNPSAVTRRILRALSPMGSTVKLNTVELASIAAETRSCGSSVPRHVAPESIYGCHWSYPTSVLIDSTSNQ
jgi:hypothetical protein